MVYAAVGIHPTSSEQFGPTTVAQLRKLAAHPKVVAIGEIGLDYHWKKVAPAQQADAFQAQLALAAELGLPVIIHNREASADVAATLTEWVHSAAFRDSPLGHAPLCRRPSCLWRRSGPSESKPIPGTLYLAWAGRSRLPMPTNCMSWFRNCAWIA